LSTPQTHHTQPPPLPTAAEGARGASPCAALDATSRSSQRASQRISQRISPRASLCASLCASLLLAAPARGEELKDDRGSKGLQLTAAFGGYGGAGTGVSGEGLGLHRGTSASLLIAEEVVPRLTIGLGSDSYFGGSADGRYEVGVYSFSLEARWRLSAHLRGLTVSGALGIGGGGFKPAAGQPASVEEASGGGGLWKLGVGYELGASAPGGFSLTPRLTYQRLGAQMGSQVSAQLVALAIEVSWESGRGRSEGGE